MVASGWWFDRCAMRSMAKRRAVDSPARAARTLRPLTTSLLVASAVLELAAGVALLVAPTLMAELLLGGGLASPQSALVGRIAGAALLAIGLTCWLERDRDETDERTGLVAGLLIYNLATAGLLTEAAVVGGMCGVLLWPAVLVHAVLLAWCTLLVRSGEHEGQGG
jgi:hypothetical protein